MGLGVEVLALGFVEETVCGVAAIGAAASALGGEVGLEAIGSEVLDGVKGWVVDIGLEL